MINGRQLSLLFAAGKPFLKVHSSERGGSSLNTQPRYFSGASNQTNFNDNATISEDDVLKQSFSKRYDGHHSHYQRLLLYEKKSDPAAALSSTSNDSSE